MHQRTSGVCTNGQFTALFFFAMMMRIPRAVLDQTAVAWRPLGGAPRQEPGKTAVVEDDEDMNQKIERSWL
jgi:hypothetical protein